MSNSKCTVKVCEAACVVQLKSQSLKILMWQCVVYLCLCDMMHAIEGFDLPHVVVDPGWLGSKEPCCTKKTHHTLKFIGRSKVLVLRSYVRSKRRTRAAVEAVTAVYQCLGILWQGWWYVMVNSCTQWSLWLYNAWLNRFAEGSLEGKFPTIWTDAAAVVRSVR